jgi:rod shape-determining protein MreD
MPRNDSGFSYWVLIAVLVILHFTLHVAIGLDASAPDLLTVAVLLAARRLKGSMAALAGLLLGVLNDALSLTAFGAEALANSMIGFLGARSRDLFEGDSLLFVVGYVFLGKWLHDVLYFVFTRSTHDAPWSTLVTTAPVAAIYAALAAMAALLVYRAATGER